MEYGNTIEEKGEVTVTNRPTIIIPEASYQKIMDYVDVCPVEISGFADTVFDRELNTITLGEVYLLKQEVSGAETEMDEEAISHLMLEFMKMGKTQLPNCWWHSHVNMGTFWSGTDEKSIEELKNNSYFLSIVVNKRREMRALLRIFGMVDVRIDDIEVEVGKPARVIPEEIKREVKEKVTEKKYTFNNSWDWNKNWNKKKKKKHRHHGNGFQRIDPGDYNPHVNQHALPPDPYTDPYNPVTGTPGEHEYFNQDIDLEEKK